MRRRRSYRRKRSLRILRRSPLFVAKQAPNGAIILVGAGQFKGRARIVGKAKWGLLRSKGDAALRQAVYNILSGVRPLHGLRRRGRR